MSFCFYVLRTLILKNMPYYQKLVLSIFLYVAFAGCSNSSSQKQTEQTEQAEQTEQTAYIRVLDELPRHIQQVENVSTFPGDLNPLYSIRLSPVQTYGKTGNPFLTHVEGCTIDDQGRVILRDRGGNSESIPFIFNVHVYHADGTYHTRLGRPGRGPGEYGLVFSLQANAGKVYLYDLTGKRINVYHTDDYSFIRSSLEERWNIQNQKVVQGLTFIDFKARNDGNLLVRFVELTKGTVRPVNKYLLMDLDGNSLDFTPFVFLGKLEIAGGIRPPVASLPIYLSIGETVTAISDEGELYAAGSQEFLIKKYNPRGVYQSATYYPVTGSSFNLSEYTEGASYSRQDVINALDEVDEELPEANPVIADMMVDDENRIWVAVPTGVQSETYEWWILKESGQLLAKLTLPRDQPICDIKNGYLYSKKTNEETGSEYVIKFEIEFTER